MIEREGGEAPQVCSHTAYGLKDFATLNWLVLAAFASNSAELLFVEYGLKPKVPEDRRKCIVNKQINCLRM